MKILILLLIPQLTLAANCIAHRGDNKNHLENSLSALKSAYESGAGGVEFDIHHTKDGVPIISHDSNLLRVATHKPKRRCSTKPISKQTFRQIRDNCLLRNGEEILLLKDVLDYYQDKEFKLFLELKDEPTFITLMLIRDYYPNNPELIHFESFWLQALDRVKDLRREYPYFKKTMLFTGALFKPKFGYDGVYLLYSKLNLRYLETIKDHKTVIWAANKRSQLEFSHQFDIDFVLTDDPKTCVEIKNEVSNSLTNIF
jgi:glycerophosphoryl diester phosphodiesterase